MTKGGWARAGSAEGSYGSGEATRACSSARACGTTQIEANKKKKLNESQRRCPKTARDSNWPAERRRTARAPRSLNFLTTELRALEVRRKRETRDGDGAPRAPGRHVFSSFLFLPYETGDRSPLGPTPGSPVELFLFPQKQFDRPSAGPCGSLPDLSPLRW